MNFYQMVLIKLKAKGCVHAFLGFFVERKIEKYSLYVLTWMDTNIDDAHKYCNNNIVVAVAHGHHA